MPDKTQPTQLSPDFDRATLLVIDVQLALFQKSTPIYKADQLIQNINTLVEQARRCGVTVIYIQHADSHGLEKGSAGWQLHPGLHPLENDPIIHKLHGNAFEDTNLADTLHANKVGQLVVTGLVTHGCVKSTCLGGRELGYPVTLVTDAHSNFSQDAVAMIEKWHAKLAEAGVTLLPTDQINFS